MCHAEHTIRVFSSHNIRVYLIVAVVYLLCQTQLLKFYTSLLIYNWPFCVVSLGICLSKVQQVQIVQSSCVVAISDT